MDEPLTKPRADPGTEIEPMPTAIAIDDAGRDAILGLQDKGVSRDGAALKRALAGLFGERARARRSTGADDP